MEIVQQVSLKDKNTFGIDVHAEYFVVLTDPASLPALAAYEEKRVLGGGSNVLCTSDIKGLVIANKTKGIRLIKEDDNAVWIEVASGEIWHELVMYTIAQGWYGLENLALIPGTVGAAPIQNIGAYGVEVKDTIAWVQYFNWGDAAFYTLNNEECRFAYRDSIFKQELKSKVFVSSVCFRLLRKAELNTSYGAIEEELRVAGISDPGPADVAAAVIRIRSSKLPDPKVIGNAGSFFKNPVISLQQYLDLKKEHHDMPSYTVDEDHVKVPAGWLIERCGWKGFRKDDYGVHAKQALVLVNYGNAEGAQLWQLSGDIVRSVQEQFGVELEREVQVW
ncbi:MAG TPA: UDP-N-acetylmuramate dehydrogenase [Chitinophagaceae bacterium]|nr:UDP-N-acetylmuramate dehydrogenase [Chitinophagaceae bacterium]